MASYIREAIPDAVVLKNMVPKAWAMADIYCQLIPDDSQREFYEIIPRLGAYEISYKGVVSLKKHFYLYLSLFSWSIQK